MSIRISEDIEIDRRPEQVWPSVADLDHELAWRAPYVIDLTADGDPAAAGTRVAGTTKAFGRTDTYLNEISAVEPARRLAWRGVEASGSMLATRGSYELEARGDRTVFRMTLTYRPQNWWGRVQEPVMGLVLRGIARRFVRQLRELVLTTSAA